MIKTTGLTPICYPDLLLATSAIYYLRSSVTGNVLAEYDNTGLKRQSNIYIGNQMVAQQLYDGTTTMWQHVNPVTGDGLNTDSTGHSLGTTALDPSGVNIGDTDPFSSPDPGFGEVPGGDMGQSAMNNLVASFFPGMGGAKCTIDGMLVGCRVVQAAQSAEAAARCPGGACQKSVRYQGMVTIAYWRSFADGYSGYIPSNAVYNGNGYFSPAGNGGPPQLGNRNPNAPRDTDFQALNGVLGPGEMKSERQLGKSTNYMPWFVWSRPMSTFEIDKLKSDVNTVLDSGDCRAFIEKLLKKAAEVVPPYSGSHTSNMIPNEIVDADVSSIVNKVISEGGIQFAPFAAASSIRGNLFEKTATIYISNYDPTLTPRTHAVSDASGHYYTDEEQIQNSRNIQTAGRALDTIHESLHFNFSDEALATAVAALNGTTPTFRGTAEASRDWNTELLKHCNGKVLYK